MSLPEDPPSEEPQPLAFGCPEPDCETRSASQYGITMHVRMKHPTPEAAAKRAENKRLREAKKKPPVRLTLAPTPDDLFERSGAALDVLFPKITGEMVSALAKLQAEMIETMQRER